MSADLGVRDVERAILTRDGVVTAQDVEALRRVCFPVGLEIAEALFDIAHATATADNDPAFADFFAEAIGAYLKGATLPPSWTDFLTQPEARSEVSRWPEERYRQESVEAERRLARAAEIDAGEAKWALAHLARGGDLSAAERRLVEALCGGQVKRRYGRAA